MAAFDPAGVPSMAQTVMQGPLHVNGSGKPLTDEELAACRAELRDFMKRFGFTEPERAHMDDPDIEWRFGGKPDYTLTNLLYAKGKTRNHEPGSLEQIVENLVKTWEMERTHKTNCMQHCTVDPERFNVSANGWRRFSNEEAQQAGNYNVLLDGADPDLYDAKATSWAQSHTLFHKAFAAFPWELLEVYSGPPKVTFSWRHWGHFTGSYDGHEGEGELLELTGFCSATVNDKLQIVDLDVYYKPENFLKVLKGDASAKDISKKLNVMCPVHGCPAFTAMRPTMHTAASQSSL